MPCKKCLLWIIPYLLTLAFSGCSGGGGNTSGGGTSSASGLSITSITPTGANVGGSGITLIVIGTNFSSNSQIEWSGSALTTRYIGDNELTAVVPASDLASAAAITITVSDSSKGTSNAVSFMVAYLTPQISTISPSQVLAGGAGFTLTVTGTNYYPASQVLWNSSPLSTTYVSSSQLTAQIPASDIAAASTATITVSNPSPGSLSGNEYLSIITSATATTLMTIPVTANDIAWDSEHGLLIASEPGVAGSIGNLATINPISGAQVALQPAGITPNLLSVASDYSRVWVGEDGSGAVQSYSLPALSPGVIATLPKYFGSVQSAFSLKTAPGSPNTIAILASTYAFLTNGIYIYDGATPRSTNTGNATETDIGLEWGATPSVLYGRQGPYGTDGMDVLNVNSSGVTMQTTYTGVLYAPLAATSDIHFDAKSGYIYDDDGRVIDPATGNIVGNFNLNYLLTEYNYSTHCVVDSSQGIVFFLGQTFNQFNSASGFTILAFDQSTYHLLNTLSIPQATGFAIDFVRWGQAGLAFNTSLTGYGNVTPAIYMVDGAFVNASVSSDFVSNTPLSGLPCIVSISPESVTAGAAATTLTVNGSNFQPGAAISWYGQVLDTTFVNSGQLQATIPSSYLATAGSADVTVTDRETSVNAINTLIFTIGDAASGLWGMNLAALNVAWDANSQLLYAGIWSGDPQYPNSIVAISPTTQQVVKSQYVGPDPYMIRTSSDGKFAYVSYMAKNAATQIQIPSLASPLTWSLEATPGQGPVIAIDMEPSPVASQTTAIATGNIHDINNFYNSFDPWQGGSLTIFDNNQPRAVSISNASNQLWHFGTLQWRPDGTILYGGDNETTAFNLYDLTVSPTGVVESGYAPEVLANPALAADRDEAVFNFYADLHFDAGTGYLYDDNGLIIDPTTGNQLGMFGSNGYAAPDSTLNKVFIFGINPTNLLASHTGCASFTINAYNQALYTPINSITLPSICGTPTAFIRWGTSGLALVTYIEPIDSPGFTGMLYLINDPTFVSANQQPSSSSQVQPVYRSWQRPALPIYNMRNKRVRFRNDSLVDH
jgi:hypothetical protein